MHASHECINVVLDVTYTGLDLSLIAITVNGLWLQIIYQIDNLVIRKIVLLFRFEQILSIKFNLADEFDEQFIVFFLKEYFM